ncbi:MAG TPA: sulfatase [Spirochaetia bacterium]|nr:sulfatase [Spirochaetia bacterium]
MKAIMVMFDSMNRHMLPPYGCDWVAAPSFARLAREAVTFDNCYAGSLPCMPARRELHTGRYNFLHRSWGPIEPFDESMQEILKNFGVYTHLVSDHYHYWEDGGATYHERYSSWEISRGQEGDAWKPGVKDPPIPEGAIGREGELWRQDWVNRQYMREEDQYPQARTMALGMEFIKQNHSEDRWFLHIETFDPHEPFFSPQRYKDLYPHDYGGPFFDWPPYSRVPEDNKKIDHIRLEYTALVSMCDHYLGQVLDLMDEHRMWKDTMLIVNTDHGFFLGEHDWWGKSRIPFYNEIVRIPLFIWDPRSGLKGGRCGSLVQTIDLAPSLLDYFGCRPPESMQGYPLGETIASDRSVREACLFGIHGGHVNCTDGRYVYMRAPINSSNQPLFNYTLMPTHMRDFFSIEELQGMELSGPFSFSKGCRLLKVPAPRGYWDKAHQHGTLLFDLESDPGQQRPIEDARIERMLIERMVALMRGSDSPPEQFRRLGLT